MLETVTHTSSTSTETHPADLSAEDLAWLWNLARRLHSCDDVGAAEAAAAEARAALERRGGTALAAALADTLGPALAVIRDRERLRTLVVRDSLTGLANRRALEEELPRQLARAADRRTPLAVAMIDLDRFRDFNERHGHPAGDIMLQSFGILLQGFRREDDVACRYGGEEFLLLMPAATAAEAAARLEGLRAALAEAVILHEGLRLEPVTASIGVAEFPAHGADGGAVVAAADEALYRAKRAGRDQIRLSGDGPGGR
jgi:diguanylate cyclase (GGDEF)-like protein